MIDTNIKAFLDMIAYSELGTDLLKRSDNGYNVVVGGSLFYNYQDHPRKKVWIKSIKNYSTAAGRYQILARYYDHYKLSLRLPDFSPNSQDAIAIQMIKEQGAYNHILKGHFATAIRLVSNIWASLPGAGYNQPERSYASLELAYKNAGGKIS